MHGRWRPGESPSGTTMLVAAGLLGLLLCGAVIRLIGIDWGRPYAYHPDEWILFRPAMSMVMDGDWNPHVYWYSSLLVDLQAVVTAVLRFAGGSSLDVRPGTFNTEIAPDQFRYLLGGRFMVVAFGVVTIVIVFDIGRRLRGPIAGLVAAAILATMPLHVSESRSLTTDDPVAMFAALTLLLTIRAERDDRERWWLLAGLAAGLAASTKWNGVLVLAVPLFVFLTLDPTARGIWSRLRRRTPYLMIGAAAIALVATTPGVVFDAETVLGYFRTQAQIYTTQRPGITEGSLPRNLRGLVSGLGPISAIVATFGVLRFLVRPRSRSELAMALFVLWNLVVVSLPARQFDRNMLPVLPFLAVIAACFIVDIPSLVTRSRRLAQPSLRPVVATVAAFVLIGSLAIGAQASVDSG